MDMTAVSHDAFFLCISVVMVALTAGLVFGIAYIVIDNLPDVAKKFEEAMRVLGERD